MIIEVVDKERIHYIDIAKGLGIFWVVLTHASYEEWIWRYSWQFHMPFFFFLAGLVYQERYSFKEFFLRRLRSLIIPYFIFAFITFIYWLWIERPFRPGDQSVIYELIGIFYGDYDSNRLFFNPPLWFLPCLFVTELLFWPAAHSKTKIGTWTWILSYFAIGQVLLRYHISGFPFGIHTALNAVLFYGIGWLSKHVIDDVGKTGYYHWVIIIACTTIQLLYMNSYVSNIKHCTILYAGIALVGITFWLLLSIIIDHQKIIEYFGRNTLVAICLQGPIMRVLIYGLSKISHYQMEDIRQNTFLTLLVTIGTFIALIPFMELWKKCPLSRATKRIEKTIQSTN